MFANANRALRRNCGAFGFGLLMLAVLPFVRGRKK